MPTFDINDEIRLRAQFTNVAGTLADPDTITFKHQDPSLNEATLTVSGGGVTKESTGIYYADLTLDESGTWYFRAEGTGTPKTAAEMSFDVRTSQF